MLSSASAASKRNAFDLMNSGSLQAAGAEETNKKLRKNLEMPKNYYQEIAYALLAPFEVGKDKVQKKDGTYHERDVYQVSW
jgi:hypothetical protein